MQSMVETWEIEWNSSMIKHGVDMGTMEFIFAKGGNLSDVNYVMLNQHDDTWEPLIKAVAERDNSHPDIILKNVAPYGVDRNFRPAIPAEVGGVTTAVGNKRQMRNLLGAQRVMGSQANIDTARAAGQAPRGRDLANTGQRMAGLGQGIANISSEYVAPAAKATAGAILSGGQAAGRGLAAAGRSVAPALGMAGQGIAAGAGMAGRGAQAAGRGLAAGAQRAGQGIAAGAGATKDFLARKFPGVKQRMGNFMQGIGDTARHGMEAAFGAKDPTTGKRSGGFFENRALRQGAKTELEQRQTGRANELERQRIHSTQAADPSTRAKLRQQYHDDHAANHAAKKKLHAEIDERGKYAGFSGLRRKIRELGDARRVANEPEATPDPAATSAAEGVEEAMEAGPAESAMADTAPPTDEPTDEELINAPTEAMPTPEAPNPQPVEADDGGLAAFQDTMVDQAGYKRGKSRKTARDIAGQFFENKPKTMDEIYAQTGKAGHRGKLAEAIAAHHGLSPQQAERVEAAAEQGDPQAERMVEEAMGGDDEEPTDEELIAAETAKTPLLAGRTLVSAERLELEGWGALMKQLNIR